MHTQKKKTQIIKKGQYQLLFSRKTHPYNTPDRGPHSNSQRIGVANYCRKDLHPRGCRDPRSFLCKCNLTKS